MNLHCRLRSVLVYLLVSSPALATDDDFELGTRAARQIWAHGNCTEHAAFIVPKIQDVADYDDGKRAANKDISDRIRHQEVTVRELCREFEGH